MQRRPENFNLSEDKKKLLLGISVGNIETVEDFVKVTCSYSEQDRVGDTLSGGKSISHGDKIRVVDSVDNWLHAINDFSHFRLKYQQMGLIQVNESGFPITNNPYFCLLEGRQEYSETVTQQMSNYSAMRLIGTAALKNFIENGFFTDSDLSLQEERRSRRTSEKWTRGLAITSIITSILTTIGTSLFNYSTYTKEREVVVKSFPTSTVATPVEIKNLRELEKLIHDAIGAKRTESLTPKSVR
jgi:hypothetical protein